MNIHLKTAGDHIRRAPFQALAAFFVLTITFFVVTTLSILVYSSGQALRFFETRPQIIAFLKDEVTPENISGLQNKLQEDVRVRKTVYVSKEEALEIYKKATADNPLLSELVSPAIFPASIEVQLADLSYAQELIEDLKKQEVVDSVGFTANLGGEDTLSQAVNKLRTVTWYIRVGGGVFAAVQVTTSLLVLMVIIGMRMTTRRGEIEILELIGATSSFIRRPVVLEATIYAVGGVFAGWFLSFVLILYATPSLISYFGDIPILPKDTLQLTYLFGIILAAEIVAGLLLAVIGSLLAVSRAKS